MIGNIILFTWIFGGLVWIGYCLFRAGMEPSGYSGHRYDWIFASMAAPIWVLAYPARVVVLAGEKYRDYRDSKKPAPPHRDRYR